MSEHTAEIVAVEAVGSDTITVELETPAGVDAVPGQFVTVEATVGGESITRYYTLSSPDAEGSFEVTVEVDPDGELGPWLAEAEPGTTVEIGGPFGRAHYEGEDRLVVIAGGPGVGPAVGIGERALADGNEVAVVYRDDNHVHEERLDALADAGAPLFVLDEGCDLDDAVAEALDRVGGRAFVYGFADFVDEARSALVAADYPLDDAKIENFG